MDKQALVTLATGEINRLELTTHDVVDVGRKYEILYFIVMQLEETVQGLSPQSMVALASLASDQVTYQKALWSLYADPNTLNGLDKMRHDATAALLWLIIGLLEEPVLSPR